MNRSNQTIEAQIISARKRQEKSCIIVNTYRPPQGNQPLFIDNLSEIIQIIDKERYAHLYVTRDLNIDHSPSKLSTHAQSLMFTMNTFGLTQMVKSPTRVTSTSSSIIDVMYVRPQRKLT